jgi:hypothetical protein
MDAGTITTEEEPRPGRKSSGLRAGHWLLTIRKIRVTRNIREEYQVSEDVKQNVTISLSRRILKKAKILAAQRETSISGLLAHELELLVSNEEAYERAQRQALALLDQGLHLGGVIRASRDELHER